MKHYIHLSNQTGRKCVLTLCALLLSVCLYAQKTLNGVVLDEQDMPLIGATVAFSGKSGGTVTDMDGKFSLKVKQGDKLTFSYIGYQTKTLTFKGQNNVTVRLEPDNKLLDEVVVVGYGSMKRSDLTGAVSSVKGEDLVGFQSSVSMMLTKVDSFNAEETVLIQKASGQAAYPPRRRRTCRANGANAARLSRSRALSACKRPAMANCSGVLVKAKRGVIA